MKKVIDGGAVGRFKYYLEGWDEDRIHPMQSSKRVTSDARGLRIN